MSFKLPLNKLFFFLILDLESLVIFFLEPNASPIQLLLDLLHFFLDSFNINSFINGVSKLVEKHIRMLVTTLIVIIARNPSITCAWYTTYRHLMR